MHQHVCDLKYLQAYKRINMLIIPQALTHNIHSGIASNPRIALDYKWTNVPIIPLIISNNCIDDLVIHQIITTHKEGRERPISNTCKSTHPTKHGGECPSQTPESNPNP